MGDRVIHISEAEASGDFAGLLARVRAGAVVVIESGNLPIAVIRSADPQARQPSDSLCPGMEHASTATDEDFIRDV